MIVRPSLIEELKKPLQIIREVPDWKEMLKTQMRVSKKRLHTYTINGFKITARCNDSTDPTAIREIFLYQTYTRYLPLEKKDVVLDLGAHIGCFSILAGSRSKKVFAFEPNDESYTLLRLNIKNNDLENVESFKKAVTNEETKYIKFFVHRRWNGCNSTLPVKGHEKVVKVQNQNLEEFLEKNKISFIKMDVEGGEYHLLPVMVKHQIPKIVFEIHKVKGYKKSSLINLLKENGYKVIIEKQWLPRPEIIHAWRE